MGDITLSPDQQEAFDCIMDHWQKGSTRLTVGGYAGTGKTTLIKEAVKALRGRSRRKWRQKDARIAFCAYTGKASEVLRRKLHASQAMNSDDYCGTIHGLIYEPTFYDGKLVGFKRRDTLDYDLIVVDESSMVNEDIDSDLSSYKVPILYVGDHGQLPPIEGQLNLMANPDIKLEKIHRQAEGNPIIKLSMMARETGCIPVGEYGPYARKISDQMAVDKIENPQDALILCNFNYFRVSMNRRVRSLLGIVERGPVVGDRVICLKNNKDAGIYNGMTGTIKTIQEHDLLSYWAEIDMDGSGLFSGLISTKQFGAEKTPMRVAGWTKEHPVECFDFGYAITVHKAQGSEADRVVLFEQRSQYQDNDNWKRWFYTAVTRARERLLIVGF